MKSTNEVRQGIEALKEVAESCGDLEITISSSGYEIHYKTLQVKVDTVKDAVEAINAFQALERLGCEDF